jgi:pilus assembly protein FimV
LVVREQMQQWRQARRPVAQPDTATAAPAQVPAKPAAAGNPPTRSAAPATKPAATAAVTPKPAAPAPRRQQAQARLEIVPPSAPGKATGTRSGTTAGGEGSMLQQQLRQKDEDIAAKAAEIGDLKERVAELEKLRQQQEQLLSMKDSELAAAQQRLADARKAAAAAPALPPATAPAAQTAQTTQPAQSAETAQPANPMPWLWGGLAFVGMALLAWLFVRRQPKPQPKAPSRRGFDSEALAASMVVPTVDTDAPAAAAATAGDEMEASAPAQTVVDLDEVPSTPPARNETPNWHSGWVKTAAPTPPAADAPQPRFVPPPEPEAPPPPKASADQRMKLARAFLDIGDDHSAKELLRELLDDADPAARTDAARMLRDLG